VRFPCCFETKHVGESFMVAWRSRRQESSRAGLLVIDNVSI
jgi:hypothetical protein